MRRDPTRAVPKLIHLLGRDADRYARQVLGSLQISKDQLFYLGSLAVEGDGITQDALAGRLRTDKSATARMLAGLERRGLLTRTRVEGNARAYCVELTDDARRLWQRVLPLLWVWHDVLVDGFTEQEIDLALELLRRMADNAARASAADPATWTRDEGGVS